MTSPQKKKTSLLICDDSRMARNQLARCLPADWPVEIHFAEDGRHCLEVLKSVNPNLIFLDLNMPNMDGYETLQAFQIKKYKFDVIVVSGDIQPNAQSRVLALGAIDFVKKPISAEKMLETLGSLGLYTPAEAQEEEQLQADEPSSQSELAEPVQSQPASFADTATDLEDTETFLDACREIANIAMGRAGDSLARFLDVFVELPVPRVNHIELSELVMALQFAEQKSTFSAVCQGFIGPGLSGEALLIFNDSSFKNIAELMKYKGEINDNVELELLMDTANILIGACLQGISDQLDINLSQGHPVVLGQHVKIPDLIKNSQQWKKTLSIEIAYSIENKGVSCDLLLLFTEDCIETLKQRISYII